MLACKRGVDDDNLASARRIGRGEEPALQQGYTQDSEIFGSDLSVVSRKPILLACNLDVAIASSFQRQARSHDRRAPDTRNHLDASESSLVKTGETSTRFVLSAGC